MTRVLLLQGANMTWPGHRQPELYGTMTAADLDGLILDHAAARGIEVEIHYTHVEGEAIAKIYDAVNAGIDGLIMNPAGFTYSGYALRDCIKGCTGLPYIEVHLASLEKRGITSALAESAVGVIAGFGINSYMLALDAMLALVKKD